MRKISSFGFVTNKITALSKSHEDYRHSPQALLECEFFQDMMLGRDD
jgi:hypothetical protein